MPTPQMNNEEPAPVPASKEAPQTPQGGAAIKERPSLAPPRVDFLPQFRVLLHNDDVNPADAVVDTIVSLTTLDRQRAVTVMLEAHTTGIALVLVTHKERAELYREQFKSKRLTVTIEPAS